jgi:hypothetical protein
MANVGLSHNIENWLMVTDYLKLTSELADRYAVGKELNLGMAGGELPPLNSR